MVLVDRLERVGHVFFRYRTWQLIPLLLIVFLERGDFARISENGFYELFCVFIASVGVSIRALTVSYVDNGTSGRNTRQQKATELNMTGAYSLVRNPLYLGNYCILLGIALLTESIEVVVFITVLFVIVYLPIIVTEEAFLLNKFGDSYRDYARRVPCIIPSYRRYVPNRRNFSLLMLARREHDTIFSTMLSLVFIEVVREFYKTRTLWLNHAWLVSALLVGLLWAVVKYLKKTRRLVLTHRSSSAGVP